MPQQKATNGSNELDGLDGMGKALLYLDHGLGREACGYDSKMTAVRVLFSFYSGRDRPDQPKPC